MSWWRRKKKHQIEKRLIEMRLFEATCRQLGDPNNQQYTILLLAESGIDARCLAREKAYLVTAIKESHVEALFITPGNHECAVERRIMIQKPKKSIADPIIEHDNEKAGKISVTDNCKQCDELRLVNADVVCTNCFMETKGAKPVDPADPLVRLFAALIVRGLR